MCFHRLFQAIFSRFQLISLSCLDPFHIQKFLNCGRNINDQSISLMCQSNFWRVFAILSHCALGPCARRLNRSAQWGFGIKEAQTKDVFWRDINGNDLRQFSATLQWGKILLSAISRDCAFRNLDQLFYLFAF